MPGLREALCAQPHAFGFFSAVALLEEYYRATEGATDPLSAGRIRFSAHPSTAFPSADLAGCRAESDGGVRLLPAFMGLAGGASPLPQYFADHALRAEEEGGPLRDFLDIFNSRLYALFYGAWRVCHPAAAPATAHPFARVLAALAGVDMDSGTGRLLPAYAGLLAGAPRSADGLAAMLSDLSGGLPVRVQQRAGRWAPLPERPALGQGMQLGSDAVLGDRYWDTAGAFRVVVGPLSRRDYEQFLPGSDTPHRMADVIRAYLPTPLDFQIEALLDAQDLAPATLGDGNARLGETACLGMQPESGHACSRVAADDGYGFGDAPRRTAVPAWAAPGARIAR